MRSEPSAGSEQGPPGAVYLKANLRPQHSGAPPIMMMTGFSAQLLSTRQCVGLNTLKETVESQKRDNFASSHVHFHVRDGVSVRGAWVFLPPETLHTGAALTGSQISLFSSQICLCCLVFQTVPM